MLAFKARVLKKIFSSVESGFSVLKVSIPGSRESRIIVGELFDVREGDYLEIEGEETSHPRFGTQLKVSRFRFIEPQDTEGIVKYLASGRFKGIGGKTAKKIVDRFGLGTLDVLEHFPERIKEIRGLRRSLVDEIRQGLKAGLLVRELTVKLAPFGIGSETIFKIHKEFGELALEVVQANPYGIIGRIRGIGFRTADAMARAVGIPSGDPHRLRAGTAFVLSQMENRNGDLYAVQDELVAKTARLLDVAGNRVQEVLEQMVSDRSLVRECIPHPVVLTPLNDMIERRSARVLRNQVSARLSFDRSAVDLDRVLEPLRVELSPEQRAAVEAAVTNCLTIITGGPGTGKTTIIRAIVEYFRVTQERVLIAAPTGRAAKRIEESTGYPASTIHRLLKINPETGQFVHHAANPLPARAVIVDEFSMVDAFLLDRLLDALPGDSRLIVIGDQDQLPSVGPGNVLRDMIQSHYFPTIFLQRNFRQESDSLIVENAHRINRGEQLLAGSESVESDFGLLKVFSDQQALSKVTALVEYFRPQYPFNSLQFQILAPMYRGPAGIDAINQAIQEHFNPEPFLLRREKGGFKRFDKVMQLKNNYEKEVFNGDQGVVEGYQSDRRLLLVNFDGRQVGYFDDELDELTLSYGISVHKAQGSEYDIVVLAMLPSHSLLLNRELLYTAVTRARKRLILLSNEQAIDRALANSKPVWRKTLLTFRLKELFEKNKT